MVKDDATDLLTEHLYLQTRCVPFSEENKSGNKDGRFYDYNNLTKDVAIRFIRDMGEAGKVSSDFCAVLEVSMFSSAIATPKTMS